MTHMRTIPKKTPSAEELRSLYRLLEHEIAARLQSFRRIWEKGSDDDLFAELVFCLLTPQCSPRPCWRAVRVLREKHLLLTGRVEDISAHLAVARFKHKKAAYIVEARSLFMRGNSLAVRDVLQQFPDSYAAREWLVTHVKGMGYKEASHFLRNIGMTDSLAILDRHILRNLLAFGVIDAVPDTMTKENYCGVERRMQRFAEEMDIPMGALDLVFWYREKGEIFK